jgi:hypothetical protein
LKGLRDDRLLLQRRERPRSARGRHRRRYAATHDRSGIWLSGVQPALWTVCAHDQADYGRNTKWSNEKAADARKMMCLRSGGRLAGFAGGPRSFYRFRAFHRSVLIMRVSKVMITALVAASAGNASLRMPITANGLRGDGVPNVMWSALSNARGALMCPRSLRLPPGPASMREVLRSFCWIHTQRCRIYF